MSSKPVCEPRRLTLVLQVTLWFMAVTFVVLSLKNVYLTYALHQNLDREDDEFLKDKLRSVRRMLSDNTMSLPEENRQSTTWLYVRVLDANGKTKLTTPQMDEHLPITAFPPIPLSRDESDSSEYYSEDGREYRVISGHAEGSMATIQVGLDQAVDQEILAEYRRQALWSIVICLVLIGVGSYLLARRALRPLTELTALARRTRPGAMTERVPTEGTKEVRELAETFNEMIDRLETAMQRLTRFSGDIAHELRTPLHRLTVGTEVALSRPRTIEEYEETLANNLDECRRLKKLIDRLLFLARADDPKTRITKTPIDLVEELSNLAEYYGPAAQERELTLTLDAKPPLQILGDAALLRQAFSNLLDNALAHTLAGGRIDLRGRRVEGMIVVEVADTGNGIAPEHQQFIFERFFRADTPRSESGRVGLGLAIVKSIIDSHAGSITLESSPRGTTFLMSFKPA
jgi:two-component system, OmpR family, heavy metal sensor histidine kinase CusS